MALNGTGFSMEINEGEFSSGGQYRGFSNVGQWRGVLT